MRSLTKKFLISAIAVSMLSTMSVLPAFADIEAGSNELRNEYIRLFVDSEDDYGLYTTGGDLDNPRDNNSRMLYYGGHLGATSMMFVNVDGVVSEVKGSHVVSAEDKNIVSTMEKSGLTIKRTLTIIPNSATAQENTVEFKMTITNNSSENHEVGGRIMLDTMLEDNDEAPFRLPIQGVVNTRTQLEGDSVPGMYQVFDNISDPRVIGTGSFAGDVDVVQFTNWGISNKAVFIPECDSSQLNGDSAVNGIWLPRTLAPGETVEYKLYYGLGQFVVNKDSELAVGATKVEPNFVATETKDAYKPVTVVGYVENTGSTTMNNVKLHINLPEGLSLAEGIETDYTVGTLEPGTTAQTSWTINAAPSAVEKEVNVVIGATSDEVSEMKTVTCSYVLPALENYVQPTEPPTEAPAPTDAPTDAPTSPAQTVSGKVVDTGDSMAVPAAIAGVGVLSAVVTFFNRKRQRN